MTIDLDVLEGLAKAVPLAADELRAVTAATVPGWKYNSTAYNDAVSAAARARNAFNAAADPETVLALIAAARERDELKARLNESEKWVVARIADAARVIGWQAGEAGCDIAGGIVSFLANHPDEIKRFMSDDENMMTDGTFKPETGALTWRAVSGEMMDAETFVARQALNAGEPT